MKITLHTRTPALALAPERLIENNAPLLLPKDMGHRNEQFEHSQLPK